MQAVPLSTAEIAQIQKFQIPGKLTLETGKCGLPKLKLRSATSEAEIYLNGATVTHFRKGTEKAILFLSEFSRFQSGQPIRGGVPIIFPWFGNKEGSAAHGMVRNAAWVLESSAISPTGVLRVELRFPTETKPGLEDFELRFVVTLSDVLEMELRTKNISSDRHQKIENCLHTYFSVGDVSQTEIHGLSGVQFIDKTNDFQRTAQQEPILKIGGEVDRVYLNTTSGVEIRDPVYKRIIRVEKNGSQSTVVWNPGPEKSKKMADLGFDEYRKMVCVESGNVGENALELKAGETSSLCVRVTSESIV